MATIKRFEDIQAWQKSRELVREVYQLCQAEKLSKDFGLKDQIRRAAVSVMSNIAEGFGRSSQRDFAHFLDVAKGSALEVQSLLYVAVDVEYLNSHDFHRLYALTDETISMIVGFTSYLRNLPNR